MFRERLLAKLIENGSLLIKTDRFFPSTKRCSDCGYINRDITLSTRKWICPHCGAYHDRDVNAAENNATENGKSFIDYELDDGWTELTEDENSRPVYKTQEENSAKVYYREVIAEDGEDQTFQVFKDGKIKYSDSLTNEDIANIQGMNISVWAQSTQKLGFASAYGAFMGNFENEDSGIFEHVFPHTDKFLYRIGNGNAVKLGNLFTYTDENGHEANSTIDSTLVKIKAEAIDSKDSVAGKGTNLEAGSSAQCTYTVNESNWQDSTLKFSGEGPVRITLSKDNIEKELYLEIVNGNNATSAASASNANIVLLNDVSTAGITISNNKTLYGNGFTVTDSRTNTASTNGFVTISNGTANNVRFVGYEPETAVAAGTDKQGYAPAVRINANAELYDCYVSGGRFAVLANEGDIYMENCVLDGGALANMQVSFADVTMKNCVTTTSTNGGLKGLGIHVASANAKLHLEGTFDQYNWLTEDDVPANYKGIMSTIFQNGEYAYTNNGKTYVNMGILCLSETENISIRDVQNFIQDETENAYGYIERSFGGKTGTCYTAKSSEGNDESIAGTEHENSQYDTIPAFLFDFTNKNYIEKTEGSQTYCYYDAESKTVSVSFVKTDDSAAFDWDPMILSVSKYGKDLSYTVAINGNDTTGSTYAFTESGNYTAVYTVTDEDVYDAETGKKTPHTYQKKVNINVVAVEPETVIYHPEFQYADTWANNAKTQVINNITYVMPDVSATNSNIGSTTVNGQTIYFPIVSVGPTTSNGNTAYSSGKGYYFAPAFNAINITDYNQNTGEVQYTYNKNTTTWPHGKGTTAGPDASVFGYADGAAFANQPYGRAMNAQYYKYGKNNSGLCYTSNEIEKDNSASQHLVQYHYTANDGTTYYYYIRYDFKAMTYSAGSCVSEDTMITMADGSQKAVKDIRAGDAVLAWDMETGKYTSSPVVFNDTEKSGSYQVVELTFSDGTVVDVITEHGFFDVTLAKYVYLDKNASQYIGHRFVKADGKSWTTATLDSVEIIEKETTPYSPVTFGTLCYYTNGMLSMPGGINGLFNIFDVDTSVMAYDKDKKAADIEAYGLLTAEDFDGIVPQVAFEAFGGKYLNIAIQKGMLTWEDIRSMADRYVPKMSE